MSIGVVLAFTAFAAVLWFFWTRFSRAARTRALQIVGVVTSLILLDLFVGFRMASTAALDGTSVGVLDIVAVAVVNLGALAGATAGAAMRSREQ